MDGVQHKAMVERSIEHIDFLIKGCVSRRWRSVKLYLVGAVFQCVYTYLGLAHYRAGENGYAWFYAALVLALAVSIFFNVRTFIALGKSRLNLIEARRANEEVLKHWEVVLGPEG